jgi:hypothetical protein
MVPSSLKIIGFLDWNKYLILHTNLQNDKDRLEELVDNGFLMEWGDKSGLYYVLHDLFHYISSKCFHHNNVLVYVI